MRKILLTLALLLPAAAFAQTTYDDGVSFGARATVELRWRPTPSWRKACT